MIVEFENCELEIGHIGTQEEILLAIFVEASEVVSNFLIDLFKPLIQLAEDMARAITTALGGVIK